MALLNSGKVLKWVPFAVLSIFFLNGCAGHQGAEMVSPPPGGNVSTPAESQLSLKEIAALKATGQIDKNIPADALNDVAREYTHYLRKGRKTMDINSRQSEKYLAYARQVFRSRGMPEELANLAIVESGFRPDAVSHAGAAGAWQFMPYTGQKYGLAQDWWQDERLDPYHATEAAADYLNKLYNDFGDWPTAIAAYNAGEGKMSRALAGSGGKDFFEVKSLNHILDAKTQLRDETKQYVPRFMAVSKIMRNLPALGFAPVDVEKNNNILRLEAAPGTDLRELTKACNLNWAEFRRNNIHHKRNITCTDKVTFVYVPASVEKKANEYLCTSRKATYAGWQPLKIASAKETLEKISIRSKTPLERLQAANPGIGRLSPGQIILAPAIAAAIPSMTFPARGKDLAAQKNITGGGFSDALHTVRGNDTLYSIARKYNVELAELMRGNGIDSPQNLRIGQSLRIPAAKGRDSGRLGVRKDTTYKVKARDNLWSIAKKHNVSVDDLKRWNKIGENDLKPGAMLLVAGE